MRVDALGNLIVRKGKKGPSGLRIMLSAHMDEIGVIATHVDENGFVRFTTIGGVSPQPCIGGRVSLPEWHRGVISWKNPMTPDEVPTIDHMFIDVGATNRATCPVKVGDVAAFDRPYSTWATAWSPRPWMTALPWQC